MIYHKTLFRNKNTGEWVYLLDRIMELEKHVRMTEDAVARILEEVVESSCHNGEGADRIREGSRQIAQGKFVLDRFHMYKYIIGATVYLKGSTEDVWNKIYWSIHGRKKKWTGEIFDRILEDTEGEAKRKTVETVKGYILGNWTRIVE